jgi:glucose/arabinose dehydrogenase
MSDDTPSDKLNMISKLGEHFGYPYCHQGDMPDPKFAMGHKCSEFTPPVLNLGAHVAPLGMKFYTGNQFPDEYKNAILIAEHGSWNRHKYQGARIVRVTADPDGKNAKQTVFADGWLDGDQSFLGRPADIILDKDGSILVADDWAGAIYRISYSK